MKKILIILTLALLPMAVVIPVAAQDDGATSVDDSVVEERLRQDGLDEAPEAIDMPESRITGEEPTSGFVDEAGEPISIDEHSQMRQDQQADSARNQIILGVVAVLVVGAIAGAVIINRRKK